MAFMAQIGSFVPAEEARIGICDKSNQLSYIRMINDNSAG